MKKLVLLASAIASISNGNATGRMTNNVLTVYAEDLVNDKYKDYSCRGGELLKRYYDTKEFSKYIKMKWSVIKKNEVIKVNETPQNEDILQLDEVSHIGDEENHPKDWTEVDLIVSGITDKLQTMLGPKSNTIMNIQNLYLNIMYLERGGKKVLLPPDSSGLFQNLNYGNKSSIRLIDFIGASTEYVINMQSMFRDQNSLIFLNLRSFDTSSVTDMSWMFGGCRNLQSLDLSHFNTNNVTDMGAMFYGCRNLTSLDPSTFDTSNVTDMYLMFTKCNNLTSLNLRNFDTSNVTNMSFMFKGCQNLKSLNLRNFDTSNVTDMRFMFEGCQNLKSLNLSNFNTEKVDLMSSMFKDCKKIKYLDLGKFNTKNVQKTCWMFAGCEQLAYLDIKNFNMSKVEDMKSMFKDCTDLSHVNYNDNFSLRNKVNMNDMYRNCRSLTTTTIKPPKIVENIEGIYEGCTSLAAAPMGDKMPIIQSDVRGDINMIDAETYPKTRENKENKIDHTFHSIKSKFHLQKMIEKQREQREEERGSKLKSQYTPHTAGIRLGIGYSF